MTEQTLLHRQIHPNWLQQGIVASIAFRPTPKDQKKLSVYDGDQISAKASWEHYTATFNLPSVGVLSLAAGECQSLDLPIEPDPKTFKEHALILFTGCTSDGQMKRLSKQLRDLAVQRGWQFRAENVAEK